MPVMTLVRVNVFPVLMLVDVEASLPASALVAVAVVVAVDVAVAEALPVCDFVPVVDLVAVLVSVEVAIPASYGVKVAVTVDVALPPSRPGCRQVPPEHTREALHTLLEQHCWSAVPQGTQLPAEQTTLLPKQVLRAQQT
jgi:hypothetical protein